MLNNTTNLPTSLHLSGNSYVGETLRLTDVSTAPSGYVLQTEWWRNGLILHDRKNTFEHKLTDADDGCLIHAEVTLHSAPSGPVIHRVASTPVIITTPAPRLRPLVLDDVMDQHSGLQPLPVAPVFEGHALRYSVLRGEADIDPVTGVLHIPTDQIRPRGRILVEGRNSGGSKQYLIQYAVEGDDTRASVTRTRQLRADGVTFTFDQDVQTGHFITGAMGAGDTFVVGPVTLLEYTPRATTRGGRDINGAMLNPGCTTKSGFDSLARGRTYDANFNAGLKLPLQLVPGDSLIVTISNTEAERSDDAAQHFVVLTCLAEVPFADSFRPPYSGPERPMWRASDIDPGLLARLPNAGRGRMPDPTELATRFGRFALEISRNWNRGHLRGEGHAPLYGRDICNNESSPFVVANLDIPYELKAPIVHGLIQRGIDRYGVFRNARDRGFHPWLTDGAHHSGRKFAILFAGHLLGDDAMRHVARQSAGEDGAEPGAFQEDGMTFHVTPEIVRVSNSDAWDPPYGGDASRPKQSYTSAMVGMPDWRGKMQDDHVNAAWTGHPYRIAGNANTQHGQVLAALAMGLKDAWGHDAYFDYHIRYMEIMDGRYDPWQFQGDTQARYNPVEGSRMRNGFEPWEKYWRDQWAWRMLMHYRFDYYQYPWA